MLTYISHMRMTFLERWNMQPAQPLLRFGFRVQVVEYNINGIDCIPVFTICDPVLFCDFSFWSKNYHQSLYLLCPSVHDERQVLLRIEGEDGNWEKEYDGCGHILPNRSADLTSWKHRTQ